MKRGPFFCEMMLSPGRRTIHGPGFELDVALFRLPYKIEYEEGEEPLKDSPRRYLLHFVIEFKWEKLLSMKEQLLSHFYVDFGLWWNSLRMCTAKIWVGPLDIFLEVGAVLDFDWGLKQHKEWGHKRFKPKYWRL